MDSLLGGKQIPLLLKYLAWSNLNPNENQRKIFLASTTKFCLYHHLQFLPCFPIYSKCYIIIDAIFFLYSTCIAYRAPSCA